jgi:hypothetical protein
MRTNIKYILILLALALFVSGCKTTFVVRGATAKQIIPIFKDYVGFHGYTMRYQNDLTGSYNVDMGVVYVPYTSETEKTKTVITVPREENSHQPMTAYEQTTWNTVSNPAHYVEATAVVNIIQQGSDVLVNIDTNDAGGASLDDLRDYLQTLGYKVENQ